MPTAGRQVGMTKYRIAQLGNNILAFEDFVPENILGHGDVILVFNYANFRDRYIM